MATRPGSSPRPLLDPKQQKRYDQAFSKSFREGWRSDTPSVLLHLVVLLVAYGLLARAIAKGGLAPGYVPVVFLVEVWAVQWLGWLLAHTLVSDPVFRRLGGRIWVPVFWTFAVFGPYALTLVIRAGGDVQGMKALLGTWLEQAWSSGLVLALAVTLLGLLVETVRDLARWRREGPDATFIWPASMQVGFRFAAMLVLPFLLLIPVIIVGTLLHVLCSGGGNSTINAGKEYVDIGACLGVGLSDASLATWGLFTWLALADLLVLFGGAWMHRKELRR